MNSYTSGLIRFINIASILIALSSCSSDDDEGINSSRVVYVDSVNGIDSVDSGTFIQPYKTITYAINAPVATSSDGTVEVTTKTDDFDIGLFPGIYDLDSGETFPIRVPEGVSIVSSTLDEALTHAAVIRGVGPYFDDSGSYVGNVALIVSRSTRIQSIIIEAPDGAAVYEETQDSTVSISKNIIRNSRTGLVIQGESRSILKNNQINNNDNVGIEILDSARPILVGNEIHGNTVGILVDGNANPQMSIQDGYGDNYIYSNASCDFRFLGSSSLNLVGNQWDSDVFDFVISSECSGGENIVNEGVGSIDYQYIPPNDLPLFPGTVRINITSPAAGIVLNTQLPEFSWIGKGSNLAMMAIWDQLPDISQNSIENKDNIVWLWHSGLGTGLNGYVLFSDGVSIIDGSLTNTESPVPLERGRSYYWAVWEWTNDGQSLLSSSNISYFNISN